MACLIERRNRILQSVPHLATASGSIASFQTDMRSPLEEIKIHFNPQQASGTPSPSNVLPITGWTALDVIDNGKNFWNNSDVIYGVWTSSTGSVSVHERGCRTQDIAASSGMVFTLWYNATQPYSASIVELDAKKGFLKRTHTQWNGAANPAPLSCTLTANTRYVYAQVAKNYDGAITYDILSTFNMQLDKGSSTSYEAFKGNKIPVSWQNTYYGGWVDAVSGVGEITYGYKDLGDFNYVQHATDRPRMFRVGSAYVKKANMKFLGELYCTEYVGVKKSYWATVQDGQIDVTNSEQSPLLVVQNDAEFTGKTGNEVKELLSGVMLAYEYTTPIPFSVTPITLKSLRGQNNIWSNANGDVDVRYWKH